MTLDRALNEALLGHHGQFVLLMAHFLLVIHRQELGHAALVATGLVDSARHLLCHLVVGAPLPKQAERISRTIRVKLLHVEHLVLGEFGLHFALLVPTGAQIARLFV